MKIQCLEEFLKSKLYTQLHSIISIEQDRFRKQLKRDPEKIRAELDCLQKEMIGLNKSLSNPELHPGVRAQIESAYGKILDQISELNVQLLASERAQEDQVFSFDGKSILEHLNRLHSILKHESPSRINIELALHIESIRCNSEGIVKVRLCKLGLIPESIPKIISLHSSEQGSTPEDAPNHTRKTRLRARRRAYDTSGQISDLDWDDMREFSSDPDRFADLPPEVFWEETIVKPEPTFWAKENAMAVAEARLSGLTREKLAENFGVSEPTITKALSIAKEQGFDLSPVPMKIPRKRWHEEHAAEVMKAKQAGLSTAQLAIKYGKSDCTIRNAFNYALKTTAQAA